MHPEGSALSLSLKVTSLMEAGKPQEPKPSECSALFFSAGFPESKGSGKCTYFCLNSILFLKPFNTRLPECFPRWRKLKDGTINCLNRGGTNCFEMRLSCSPLWKSTSIRCNFTNLIICFYHCNINPLYLNSAETIINTGEWH